MGPTVIEIARSACSLFFTTRRCAKFSVFVHSSIYQSDSGTAVMRLRYCLAVLNCVTRHIQSTCKHHAGHLRPSRPVTSTHHISQLATSFILQYWEFERDAVRNANTHFPERPQLSVPMKPRRLQRARTKYADLDAFSSLYSIFDTVSNLNLPLVVVIIHVIIIITIIIPVYCTIQRNALRNTNVRTGYQRNWQSYR